MPIDVIVFHDPLHRTITSTEEFQTLFMLPLDPGTYLVIAKGAAVMESAYVNLRLEVGDGNDEVFVGSEAFESARDAFCLTVGTTLTPSADPDF